MSRRKCPCRPKFDRTLKRLVTERDAKRIRKRGRIIGEYFLENGAGKVIRRSYKGATFHEFVSYYRSNL